MVISIIGFPFSGKSTYGERLASDLGWEWVDLDSYIEKRYGSIEEIISTKGEEYFRDIESQSLLDFSNEVEDRNIILSCGGGTPLRPGNQLILKGLGKILWLDTPFEIIAKRIEESPQKRAIFANCNSIEEIKKIYEERRKIYESLE